MNREKKLAESTGGHVFDGSEAFELSWQRVTLGPFVPTYYHIGQIDFDKIFSKFPIHLHRKKWTQHLGAMF